MNKDKELINAIAEVVKVITPDSEFKASTREEFTNFMVSTLKSSMINSVKMFVEFDLAKHEHLKIEVKND